MRDSADEDYRVVIDEEGLDWRGRSDTGLILIVDSFSDLLEPLADGRQVAIMIPAYGVECWESVTLVAIPYTTDRRVSRDARLRLARLLDKCRAIEPEESDDVPQPIRLHGTWREPSWGMAHALARAAAGRAMSCLTGPISVLPSGWTTIERESDRRQIDVHLLSDPAQLPGFWRGVFDREPVPESAFFGLATLAFPRLIFAHDLVFHRFKGSYAEVVPWLIRLLASLDDHFVDAITRHRGDRNKVIAEFSTYGVEISPESPSTRNNSKAWAQRLIGFEGVEYRCEWHGKRLWNHDRVHFSLPIANYGNRILIGAFEDHLL